MQAPLHDPAVLQIYPRHSFAHRADQLVGDGVQDGGQVVHLLSASKDLHLVSHLHCGQVRQIHHGHIHADPAPDGRRAGVRDHGHAARKPPEKAGGITKTEVLTADLILLDAEGNEITYSETGDDDTSEEYKPEMVADTAGLTIKESADEEAGEAAVVGFGEEEL